MEISLNIQGDVYDNSTIHEWQLVWEKICNMAYADTDIYESIVTRPGVMIINGRKVHDKRELSHSREYARTQPINRDLLMLDHVWNQYSNKEPKIVPEFKNLVVPYPIYQSLGINAWFKYSFPNCKVTFWKA
jgi:hypothetical protein